MRENSNEKLGLVLEGGAMRGLFSAGVFDALLEHNIIADGVVGVSAGAAFGCNYKVGTEKGVLSATTNVCPRNGATVYAHGCSRGVFRRTVLLP